MLTLADLGVLRDVEINDAGRVVVTITPTYSGCPAMDTMRADLRVALRRAGFSDVEVRTTLSPPWSSEWISPAGRAKLTEHGIAPPGPVQHRRRPVLLSLSTRPPTVQCPICAADQTRELSRFGSTACRSIHLCEGCGETFDHIKELG